MAHRNDPDYKEPEKVTSIASKMSIKELHEKAHRQLQNSQLKISNVHGATRGDPISNFTINCGKHDHPVTVDHDVKTGAQHVSMWGPDAGEESDPDPIHEGSMDEVLKHLKKCGKTEDDAEPAKKKRGRQYMDEEDDDNDRRERGLEKGE